MKSKPREKSYRFQESAAFEKKANLTRAKIMDAAINVIAKKGVQKASILEITQFAGMANGTFYLYFKNKNELVEQVGFAISAAIVHAIHSPELEHRDAARLVARHLFCFLYIASLEHTWIPLIIDALGATNHPRDRIEHGIRTDIDHGRTSGRFDVPECEEVVSIILSLCRIGLERVLGGAEIATVQLRIMEAGLRVLGISADESRAISVETLQLPEWDKLAFPSLTRLS